MKEWTKRAASTVIGLALGLLVVFLASAILERAVIGAQVNVPPSNNTLATFTLPAPREWSRTQLLTVGNLSNEVSSATIYTTTTAVVAWVSGEDALVNGWSTSKTDIGTTNGILVTSGGAAVDLSPYRLNSTVWAASRTATSATVVLLEFHDANVPE